MIHSINTSSTSFKCIQINLRHSRAAALHLSQLLLDMDVDVAFIQEPYATLNPSPSLKYVPDGYIQLHSLSADHAYGAAIVVKRIHNPTLLPLAVNNCAAGAEITVGSQKFFLLSIYCRPSIKDLQSFLLTLSSSITPQMAGHLILCTDSNAMNPLWNSKALDDKGRTMEEFCRAIGLSVANIELRHLSHIPSNTSFPDITLIGDDVAVSEWKFLDVPSLSDHPYIYFSLVINVGKSASQTRKMLPRLETCSIDDFISSLESELCNLPALDPYGPVQTDDIDIHISDLIKLLSSCAISSKLPSHPSLAKGRMPWWSDELWALRHQLRRAYQAMVSFPSVENSESYSLHKANYQRRLRERKTESWKEFCTNNFNGDLFGAIRRLADPAANQCPPPLIKINGAPVLDPNETLKAFSDSFFPKAVPNTISQLVLKDEVQTNLAGSIGSYESISKAEVITAIDFLKSTRTPGTDGYPADWLKCCSSQVATHISALFNACLATSYFPRDWRVAKVIILRKQNKPHYDDPSCYRPISIICCMSKVFERILHSRLKALAESASGSWFNDSQHGFRVGRSTESAGSTLASIIENNLKKKLFTCCAFLDIKGAFDAAWQPAILHGLQRKGCPLYLVKILSSFLNSRKAEFSCNGFTLVTETDLGCPQGSVLSPFLWNILVDSLLDASFHFPNKIIAYADDLVVCTWDSNLDAARLNLQQMIDYAISWGSSVKLLFNASKTVYMVFTRKRSAQNACQPVIVNNTPITPSRTCTYLGLVLDERLNWREHVTNKCLSLKRLMFLVNKCCRLTWGLSRGVLSVIYKAIFLPKLLYGCLVWGGALKNAWCRKLLRAAQRPFALAISRSFRTNSTLSALTIANILPVDYVIKKRISNKALMDTTFPLAPSSFSLVRYIVTPIKSLQRPSNCTEKQFFRSMIRENLAEEWNNEWVTSPLAPHTKLFFPTVSDAAVLASLHADAETVQVLTGHCMLNHHSAKIKKRTSAVCDCGADDETVHHFLFHCNLYKRPLADFKRVVMSKNVPWPPDLSLIPKQPEIWAAMVKFIHNSKRLRLNRGSATHLPHSSDHNPSNASLSAGRSP